jgi:hypothetical protein
MIPKILRKLDISEEKMIISACSYQRREAYARGVEIEIKEGARSGQYG